MLLKHVNKFVEMEEIQIQHNQSLCHRNSPKHHGEYATFQLLSDM